MKNFVIIASFLMFVSPVFCSSVNDVLKSGAGAAAGGMGDAYTAMGGNTDAIFFNPASLVRLGGAEASFNIQTGQLAGESRSAVFGCMIGSSTALAAGMLSFQQPYLFAAQWDTVLYPPLSADQTDSASVVAFARKISPWIDAGIGLKSVSSDILGYTAQGPCMDLGLAINRPRTEYGRSRSRYGVALRNLGNPLRFQYGMAPIVNELRAGWSNITTTSHYSGNEYDSVTAIDVVKYSDSNYLAVDMGFEFRFTPIFTLRLGFRAYTPESTSDIGAGFTLPVGKTLVRIDYVTVSSFAKDTNFNTHRVSVKVRI